MTFFFYLILLNFRTVRTVPPRCCLHLIVVRRFEYTSDPESYASGSVATGRASLAGQVIGHASDEETPKPKLMPEAVSSVAAWSTEQMMLEMVQVRITTGVTRVV